eukprot:12917125-Prorocentrum_lima.AAC.1
MYREAFHSKGPAATSYTFWYSERERTASALGAARRRSSGSESGPGALPLCTEANMLARV